MLEESCKEQFKCLSLDTLLWRDIMSTSLKEPAAKDFVARKAYTINLSEAQGTHWRVIRCKEHLANCPEAVLWQATINLDPQVWKSLEDSLPKLYCVDLAEAFVMWESASLRILCEKKGMICICPTDVCTRNLRQKAEREKKTCAEPITRFLWACFEKLMRSVPDTWGCRYGILPQSAKGKRKWDKKLDSRAAKKGANKLLSSNFAKTL